MFKNQLQELAQRSCFNLPAYACIREGPDHAPRFRACVNFNGEIFQSPGFSPTLRQAEHSAAEVALNLLSSRGSKSLTARVLDETGVYKNLLQETAHKAGLNLPVYTTIRSGPGHVPVFTCTVELAGLTFTGHSAKTKKQAEKNAAISAWSSLKKMPSLVSKKESSLENNHNEVEEEEEVIVRRVLSNFSPQNYPGKHQKDHHYPHNNHQRRSRNNNARPWRSYNNNNPWKQTSEFPDHSPKQRHNSFVDLLPPPPPRTTSKMLPLTCKNNGNYTALLHDIGTTSKILPLTNNVLKEEGQDGNVNDVMSNKANNGIDEIGQSYFRNLFFGPSSCAQRDNSSKGFAQAVQIRSIIPVCASPPAKSLIKPLPLNPSFTTQLTSDLITKLELNN